MTRFECEALLLNSIAANSHVTFSHPTRRMSRHLKIIKKPPKHFNKYLLNVFCIQFSMNNYRYFPQYRSPSLKINIFWTKLWNKDACQNRCFEVPKMPKAQICRGLCPLTPTTALPWTRWASNRPPDLIATLIDGSKLAGME